MSMITEFFRQLFESGQSRLQSSDAATEAELQEVTAQLVEWEVTQREHLPNLPPRIDTGSLTWAAEMLYHAAQLAVFRELGEDEIERRLRPEDTGPTITASTVYSVDLVFRHLPDLIRIVRGINPGDPLIAMLKGWCRWWPFSSVGVANVGEIDIEPILSDRCLSLMYADRILAAEDISRLDHPGIAELVRGAIGAWPELSPKLAAKVAET